MIDKPGILLSFDDTSVSAWHLYLPFFDGFNIHATFYVSQMGSLSELEWHYLLNMQDAGHVIGHHGFRHRRAGEVGVPRDPGNLRLRDEPIFKTWEEFVKADIDPGIAMLEEHGLRCQHYSYPYGNHSNMSDKKLSAVFRTLRIGGRCFYNDNKIPRIYAAANFGKYPDRKLCGHEGLLELAGKNSGVVCFYMHEPVKHRLEYLGKVAQKYSLKFYTAGDIP